MLRSRTVRWTAGCLVTVLMLAAASGVQQRVDTLRRDVFDEELLYLPSERLLTHFTGGMSSIVADVLWIQCVKYTARHFKGDRKFTWLNHMCNLITRLDPNFVAVYRYGGIFLAALKADDDASIDLLKRGFRANPYAWELPYEIAMTWLLNRGTWPNARVEAARYLAMAVETGCAPQYVIDIATGIQAAQDLDEMERAMWENTIKSGDKLMRDVAQRKLIELDLRLACKDLNAMAEAYRSRTGRSPKTLDDLVTAGLLQAVPVDPLGGRFFFDSAGKIQSSTVLDGQVDRLRNNIMAAIRAYKKQVGTLPPSLQATVDKGLMFAIPQHPYGERQWHYDPATGDVQ